MSPVIPVPGRLEGSRVGLRPLRDDDVPRYLAAFAGDPALGRDVGLPRDPDEAAARAAVAATLRRVDVIRFGMLREEWPAPGS